MRIDEYINILLMVTHPLYLGNPLVSVSLLPGAVEVLFNENLTLKLR